MAGKRQFLAWLMVAICLLLLGLTTTQHYAGQAMDSTSMGSGLQEPEAPEVMFELLWAGLELDVMGQLHIQDEELASTRPGHRLRLLLKHHMPSDWVLSSSCSSSRTCERGLLLALGTLKVYLTGLSCVYRLHKASKAEERGCWAHVFARLAQETLWDWCKGFCPQGQSPSLGPWL